MAAKKNWPDEGRPKVSTLVESIRQLRRSCDARLVPIDEEADHCLQQLGVHRDLIAHADRAESYAQVDAAHNAMLMALDALNEALAHLMHMTVVTPAAPPKRKKSKKKGGKSGRKKTGRKKTSRKKTS